MLPVTTNDPSFRKYISPLHSSHIGIFASKMGPTVCEKALSIDSNLQTAKRERERPVDMVEPVKSKVQIVLKHEYTHNWNTACC